VLAHCCPQIRCSGVVVYLLKHLYSWSSPSHLTSEGSAGRLPTKPPAPLHAPSTAAATARKLALISTLTPTYKKEALNHMTMPFQVTGALFVGRQQPWCTDARSLQQYKLQYTWRRALLGSAACTSGSPGFRVCTGGFQLYTCTAAALGNGPTATAKPHIPSPSVR